MMQNDSHIILDDLLSRWHHWSKGYIPIHTCSADPMFRNAKSPHSSHSAGEVTDDQTERNQMAAVDFNVGEMKDPHRSAIYIHARNCYTGRNVWLSPRLPQDPMERARILGEAKTILIGKLLSAGVM
jgi:hypothetical protein